MTQHETVRTLLLYELVLLVTLDAAIAADSSNERTVRGEHVFSIQRHTMLRLHQLNHKCVIGNVCKQDLKIVRIYFFL